ncbi:ABC transporter permease [Paenibacillus sp. CAU 1782]
MKVVRRFVGAQLVGFISFLILWQLIGLALDTHVIPTPAETIKYMLAESGDLVLHAGGSLLRVLTAIAVSLAIAVPTGLLLGGNKWFRTLVSPFVYFIYPIPKVAFLPVFMLLFGLGNVSKIILMIWIIMFQIMLSVRDGVDSIPKLYFQVMKGFRAGSWHTYRYLVLPAVLPHMFTGLRISIGISLASLFFAENYATTYGIGYYILSAWTKMNYPEMFGGILTLGIVGLLLFKGLDALQTKCTPWKAERR